MGIVVSLEGLVPIPRYDNKSFTRAEIYESANPTGPWQSIEVINFAADPDPADPQVRNLTTENAVEEDGWYYVIFSDADNDMQLPTVPMKNARVPELAAYVPTVDQVAALLRARTKDKFGNEAGTFNANTRPTAKEVIELIGQATSDVTLLTDYDVPEEMYHQIADLIALGTAMRVEISYFPEQVGTDRTAFDELERLYKRLWDTLVAALEREKGEEATGDENYVGGIAFGFPTAEPLWTKRF